MDFFPPLYELIALLPGGHVLWAVFMFILGLGLLVFFHEWGHYLAARSVGVHVEAFSIGFGKELGGWTDKNGTRWKFALIPLGGYVKMRGEGDDIEVQPEDESGSFSHKNVWQRIWVVSAGPLANFLLAIVIYFLISFFMGKEPLDSTELPPVIGMVHKETAAFEAGLMKDDRVLAIDGVPIHTFIDLVDVVSSVPIQEYVLEIERGPEIITVPLTPRLDVPDDIQEQRNIMDYQGDVKPMIGVTVKHQYRDVDYTFVEAFSSAVERTWFATTFIYRVFHKMLVGEVSPKNMGGPITIADLLAQAASQGAYFLFALIALISVNLGVINLLPIPMLDGGHLMYFFVEAIKGSPVSDKTQAIGHKIGAAFVAALFVLVFYNDINRLIDKIGQ